MSRIPLIGWLLLVFMVGAPSSVLAQGAPQGAEEEVDPAFTQTLSEGQAAFKAGRFKEAAELFRQAFEIDPRGNLLFNVAICYEKAGDTIAAVKFYERFIAAVPNARNRPQVQQQIVALKASLADKYVEVQVTTAPKGAYVFIDSKSQGTIGATPTTLKLLPGSPTLIVEKPDYETVKVPLDVAEGQPQQLEYVLVNSQKVGSVRLRIPEKGASVMVDGKNIGVSPIKDPIRLPQGPHEISVLKPGLTPWKKNVNVFAGQNSVVTVTFREEDAFDPLGDAGSSGGGDKLWASVTMGTGVAMIAGGVFTGLSAQSLHDDLTAKRENQELIAQSDIDLGNTLVTTTNILLIGGTLAAAGGAVWWYLSDDEVDPDGEILTGGFFASPDGTAVFHLKGTF